MNNAYLVDGIRTPIGKLRGALSAVRADDLAALPLRELLRRNPSVPPVQIEDVILGCANQAGEDNRNVARMAGLLAGLPASVPGQTLNRLCASGMTATISAFHAIRAGEGDLFLTGGMEHMTRGPMVLSKSGTPYGSNPEMHDSTFGWRFVNPLMEKQYGAEAMGRTAENLASEHNISRTDQDRFAYLSQQKATRSRDNGRFAREIMPVEIPRRKGDPFLFEHDEFIRPGTTEEVLATLHPVFRSDGHGSVTAGNASGLNDGSCALLVASEQALTDYGLTPKARIVGSASVGVEPRIMGIGPVGATHKVLMRSGLHLADMDIIELNEAFAAQSLAVLRTLGLEDEDPRVNPNGGAIALGHPLGMSGARLLTTAMIELHEQQKRHALCALCVGVGQGVAMILERC